MRKQSPWIFAVLLAAAISPGVSHAADGFDKSLADPAKYPCDVFDFQFCLRKPYGVAVTQRDGPDFGIYEFASDGSVLFSIYVGMAPQRESDKSRRIETFEADGVNVAVLAPMAATNKEDIEIRISYSNGVTVHAFGARNSDSRAALAEAMLTFRVCSKSGFTGIECESKPLFTPERAKLISQYD